MKKHLEKISICSVLLVLLCAVCVSASADTPITADYVIVYPQGSSSALEKACDKLQKHMNLTAMPVTDDMRDAGPFEILVGNTNRPESGLINEKMGMYDYKVLFVNGKIIINGGSDTAIVNAMAHVVYDALIDGPDGGTALPDGYEYFFDGADCREEYVNNPDAFLCTWALDFDPPEWMRDFDEKIASFNDPDGRMMSMLHRADRMNYPDNSIEGIISAIKMGADSMELDLHITKDGVPVLFHDANLARHTDWRDKAGKNGLPESDLVKDWTYEELKQLRLLNLRGVASDCQIASLEEAIIVCKDRIMFRLDKAEFWDWEKDVYPLIKKHQAWQVCISMNYQYTGQITDIVDIIRADGGDDPVMLYYGFTNDNHADWQDRLEGMHSRGYNPVAVVKDLVPKGTYTIGRYIDKTEDSLEKLEKNARIFLLAFSSNGAKEDAKTWDSVYEKGCNYLMVDNGVKFQQYIAERVGED
ncbi:MAG: glycerophosphodiester phosphodiesterase family protein [Clostridiales bacterium]|nr:glycerophosphodiester phosphodiesterase family protein [Clostridiales bacterium]